LLLIGTTLATLIYLKVFTRRETLYGEETTTGI
jgi:hypothetical protein